MEGIYIRWTIENWITVLLMAALGYMLFAVASQVFLTNKAKAGPTLSVVAS